MQILILFVKVFSPSLLRFPFALTQHLSPSSPYGCFTMAYSLKVSTVISVFTTFFVTIYYFTGANFLPSSLILIAAAQILFQGALALNDLLLHALAHLSFRKPVPLDLISLSILQMSTRTSPSLSLPYQLLNAFVSLFLVHTPDVLLTSLASNTLDIRQISLSNTTTELASFGGGFDRSTYYTAGLLLLASTKPTEAYPEIAHYLPHSGQWIVPRKPVIWYRHFYRTLSRENDLEPHLYVPENKVAVLTPVPPSAVTLSTCQVHNRSDFGYSLVASSCSGGLFGFDVNGPTLEPESRFFRLTTAVASVRYSSRHNLRSIDASHVRQEVTVPVFPRHGQLMRDMHRCFLNVVSFNRAPFSISVTERLALSSLVRVAGFDTASGFSDPGEVVDVEVGAVRISEVSRFLVLTMAFSVGMIAVAGSVFTFSEKVLSRELGQWIQVGRGLTRKGVWSAYPRGGKVEEKETRHRGRVWVNLLEESKGLIFNMVEPVGKTQMPDEKWDDAMELAGRGIVATASGAMASVFTSNVEV